MAGFGPGPLILGRYRVLGAPEVPPRSGDPLMAPDRSFGRVGVVVPSPHPMDPPAGALFARRAQTAGALRHPILPMSYDMGWQDGHAILISQHVDGPPVLEAVLPA